MMEKLPEGTLSISGMDVAIAYSRRADAERAFAILETMLCGPPKPYLSMSRKISELGLSLAKSEATIRNQQVEIERLHRQLADAKSQGWAIAS